MREGNAEVMKNIFLSMLPTKKAFHLILNESKSNKGPCSYNNVDQI